MTRVGGTPHIQPDPDRADAAASVRTCVDMWAGKYARRPRAENKNIITQTRMQAEQRGASVPPVMSQFVVTRVRQLQAAGHCIESNAGKMDR